MTKLSQDLALFLKLFYAPVIRPQRGPSRKTVEPEL